MRKQLKIAAIAAAVSALLTIGMLIIGTDLETMPYAIGAFLGMIAMINVELLFDRAIARKQAPLDTLATVAPARFVLNVIVFAAIGFVTYVIVAPII